MAAGLRRMVLVVVVCTINKAVRIISHTQCLPLHLVVSNIGVALLLLLLELLLIAHHLASSARAASYARP